MAEEVARWEEHCLLLLRTCVWFLTHHWLPSYSTGSDPLFWPLQALHCTNKHMCTYTHTYTRTHRFQKATERRKYWFWLTVDKCCLVVGSPSGRSLSMPTHTLVLEAELWDPGRPHFTVFLQPDPWESHIAPPMLPSAGYRSSNPGACDLHFISKL